MRTGEHLACPASAGLLVGAGPPQARARPFPTGCLRGRRTASAHRAGSGSRNAQRHENDGRSHQPACRVVGDDARQHDPDCAVEQRRAKGMPTRKARAVGDLDDLDQIGRRPGLATIFLVSTLILLASAATAIKAAARRSPYTSRDHDDRCRDQRLPWPHTPNRGEGDSQSIERRRWPSLDDARNLRYRQARHRVPARRSSTAAPAEQTPRPAATSGV